MDSDLKVEIIGNAGHFVFLEQVMQKDPLLTMRPLYQSAPRLPSPCKGAGEAAAVVVRN